MATRETEVVERYSPQIAGATDEGFLPMDRTVNGEWVRYEDYERVREERDEAREEIERRLAAEHVLRKKLPPRPTPDQLDDIPYA